MEEGHTSPKFLLVPVVVNLYALFMELPVVRSGQAMTLMFAS